ncbi:amidohydrolase [Alteromonas sp. C1M14]|nr:amidohydrolase [Alteromonas sp. C1M14]
MVVSCSWRWASAQSLPTKTPAIAEVNTTLAQQLAAEVQPEVVRWRRYLHQHPELSNREFQTAEYIIQALEPFGLTLQTKVAHTGVVAVLDSGKPGPVVALRADMDALPIKESLDLPFASNVVTEVDGKPTPVMHACGHDAHVAMLLGAAKILSENRDKLIGKVKFIFQPAEEGPPNGEAGGAKLMVEQGVVDDVDVIFALHLNAHTDIGMVKYKPGGLLAAVDPFKITLHGKPAHGAFPWLGVDPIVASAQVIMGLQTIVSREIRLIDEAAVLTVGTIQGGVRSNVIAESVTMSGTIRTLNHKARQHMYEAVPRKVNLIAESMNVTAQVELPLRDNYPVTFNPPALMDRMLPTLLRTAGTGKVKLTKAKTAAEDFSFFQQQVPGLYLLIGSKDPDMPLSMVADHHSPDFYVDERGLSLGVTLFLNLTTDYMGVHL